MIHERDRMTRLTGQARAEYVERYGPELLRVHDLHVDGDECSARGDAAGARECCRKAMRILADARNPARCHCGTGGRATADAAEVAFLLRHLGIADEVGMPTTMATVTGPDGESEHALPTWLAAAVNEARERGIPLRGGSEPAQLVSPSGAAISVEAWIANAVTDLREAGPEDGTQQSTDAACLRTLRRSGLEI
jgi:hypothetical protein